MITLILLADVRFRVSSSVASFLNPYTGEMCDNSEYGKSWLTLEEGTEITVVAASDTPDMYACVVKDVIDAEDEEAFNYSGIVLRRAQYTKMLENSCDAASYAELQEEEPAAEAAA